MSSHYEKVYDARHPPIVEDARTVGGVCSSGAAIQPLAVSLGQTDAHPELGLFLQKGTVEVALGYGDFLEGIEELKAFPLKERRRDMKNEAFRVSYVVAL